MKKIVLLLIWLLPLTYAWSSQAISIPYQVIFQGTITSETEATLRSASQLVILEEYPPATLTALKKRAEADIPNLLQGLRSLAYYDAKVNIKINSDITPIIINIEIDTGPVYPLTQFRIVNTTPEDKDSDAYCRRLPFSTDDITLEDLGIELGMDALPKNIIDAERLLLQIMSSEGYPLAAILKREVIADQAKKTIAVTLYLDNGALAYFGNTLVSGRRTVAPAFIQKKIAWQLGDVYDPVLIERTQLALENTGLFSSIAIVQHDENADDQNYVPIEILLVEAKHRTIGFGASYIADLGPGVLGFWEHRNLLGKGERLKIHVDIWLKRQVGKIIYAKPDFLKMGQDLLLVAEAESERTRGFSESFCRISGLLDRPLTKNLKLQYGLAFKQLKTERSDNNGSVPLLKTPLQLRWRHVNDILNPTRGATFTFSTEPTLRLINDATAYHIIEMTGTHYLPITPCQKWVIASKVQLGSILGSSRAHIPPP